MNTTLSAAFQKEFEKRGEVQEKYHHALDRCTVSSRTLLFSMQVHYNYTTQWHNDQAMMDLRMGTKLTDTHIICHMHTLHIDPVHHALSRRDGRTHGQLRHSQISCLECNYTRYIHAHNVPHTEHWCASCLLFVLSCHLSSRCRTVNRLLYLSTRFLASCRLLFPGSSITQQLRPQTQSSPSPPSLNANAERHVLGSSYTICNSYTQIVYP